MRSASSAQVAAVKDEASAWAPSFEENIVSVFQASGGQTGGIASGKDREEKGPSADKKEVAVWKLPENVTKQMLRHWIDTADTNLDTAHYFKFSELVLDKVEVRGQGQREQLVGHPRECERGAPEEQED